MSGHSKWATIRRKKEKTDGQRASAFTKVTREIIVAAKNGGDPEHNFRLRLAVLKAKAVNMPNENIQRAIKRGSTSADSTQYEEVWYEGYGPEGVALLVQALTDNRNRTAGEMRYIFSRNHGNLGEAGCVAWLFSAQGLITIVPAGTTKSETELWELAIEAGATDLKNSGESYEVYTAPDQLEAVRQYLEAHQLVMASAELTMLPDSTVEVRGEAARQLLQLVEALEENDDVQNVYANFEIPDSVWAELGL